VSDAWARTSITVFGPSGEVEQTVDFDGETLDEQLHAAEAWLGGRAESASESELRQVRLFTPWSPADGRHAEPLAHSRKGAGRRRRHILDGCLSVRRLTPPDYSHSRFKPRDSRPLMPRSARACSASSAAIDVDRCKGPVHHTHPLMGVQAHRGRRRAAVLGSSTRPIDNCLSDDRSMIAPEGSARQPSAGLPTSDTARTEAFSDGVFAIAITLLGLKGHIPDAERIRGAGGLLPALLQLWPGFLSYLASFVTIGVIWLNHHAVFAKIAAVDQTVRWSNLLLLLTYGDARAKVDQVVVVNVHQNSSTSTRDYRRTTVRCAWGSRPRPTLPAR